MATCKDCLHYEIGCSFTPTDLDCDVFDYCRKGISDEIPDIEKRCDGFKDKAEYAPVVHAHWIRTNSGKWRCSACRGREDRPMRYCGECGARMNERKSE